MKHKVGEFRSKAEIDLRQILRNEPYGYDPYESTCVHAQQYAEKMLKEALVILGRDPNFIHSLETLVGEVSDASGIDAPSDIVMYASTLDQYYINVRYPSRTSVYVDAEVAEEAFLYAKAIVEWSESIVRTSKSNRNAVRSNSLRSTNNNEKSTRKRTGIISRFRR